MYTGRTGQPCRLCDDSKTAVRITVPPRAVMLMGGAVPIAWRDVIGNVTLQFYENDWGLVIELVLDLDTHPLSWRNVARADLSVHEDFETLLNSIRDEPDQIKQEDRPLAEARAVIDDADDPMAEERDLVEAHAVVRVMAELSVDQPAWIDP